MKWKKKLSLLLSIAIVITSAIGCSKTEKKEKNDIAMGRYIEKSIAMPEEVENGNEIAFIMIQNPKKEIEIYASHRKTKKGEYIIQYTLKNDGTWERRIPKWLNEKKCNLNCITYTEDGTKYAVVESVKKNKLSIRLMKSKDNEQGEEIHLEEYAKEVDYSMRPLEMEVLKDNSILLGYYGMASVYKNGIKDVSFKYSDCYYAVSDNKMLTVNEQGDGGIIVDLDTGKTIAEVPVDTSSPYQFAADNKGNWYQVNSSGIKRMTKEGSTWETVLDGDLASMSMPSMYPDDILFGAKDDFYVMYEHDNGIRTIKHYVYDKDVPTTPSKTLSVVSLYEYSSVRQAIADYQHKHQDVQVEYRALMSQDDGTTVSDHIKTINTELLAGKGADLIILDHMPMESYIEKGALDDISDIIEPMEKRGDLLNNIIDHYKTDDGKLYYAPLRISIVFGFGQNESVKATKNLKSLADYASKASIPIFGSEVLSYTDITKILLELYSNSFLDKNGFNRDGLLVFLNQLKVISDQTKTTEEESKYPVTDPNEMIYYETLSTNVYSGKSLLGITELGDMFSAWGPIAATDKIKGTYGCINGQYKASGYVSINKNSTQKDLAADFIRALFSEDTQKAELGEGFPVNTRALRNYGMKLNDDDYVLVDEHEIMQPNKEKRQSILDMCKTLTTPINLDDELVTMVTSVIIPYLSGKEDAESTADQIIDKTKAYLSE